ncbi:hypothetical protein H4219_002138 [Mycoemilia scoparia]|uniref:DOMON domain-containing protein n=1 Tax=Mycoemilia scoparia TaxID=417184 RepID=A0A9W8DPH8_9FUNG|nr:hypothetical protein H4219_002138 [Mycoemilia scoparia]
MLVLTTFASLSYIQSALAELNCPDGTVRHYSSYNRPSSQLFTTDKFPEGMTLDDARYPFAVDIKERKAYRDYIQTSDGDIIQYALEGDKISLSWSAMNLITVQDNREWIDCIQSSKSLVFESPDKISRFTISNKTYELWIFVPARLSNITLVDSQISGAKSISQFGSMFITFLATLLGVYSINF